MKIINNKLGSYVLYCILGRNFQIKPYKKESSQTGDSFFKRAGLVDFKAIEGAQEISTQLCISSFSHEFTGLLDTIGKGAIRGYF